MLPLDAPALVFMSVSRPAIVPRRRDSHAAMISLTPRVWFQLGAWAGDDAPAIPEPSQMPHGVMATAQALMLLPARAEGKPTVLLRLGNSLELRVRLLGIDVPEPSRRDPRGRLMSPGQPYSDEAMAYLPRLVQNRHVRVEIYGVDPHHRFLGTIFLAGQNLNLALVEAGLAEVFRGPGPWNPYYHAYEAAETAAHAAKRGMWALGDQYESPHDYRRRMHLHP